MLAKVSIQNGKVEIKCKCGTLNVFSAATDIKPEGRQGREREIKIDQPVKRW